MLLFNTERIQRKPKAGTDASHTGPHYRTAAKESIRPFLPGQVYLVRHAGQPTICVVQDRSDTTVTWHGRKESLNRFNLRVISYLGYRASFMGVWLPWAFVQPGVLVNDMPTVTYNDIEFWKVHRQDLEVADKQPAPERDGIAPVSQGI